MQSRIHLIFSGPIGVRAPLPLPNLHGRPPTALATEETLDSKDLKNTVLNKLLCN